MVGDKPGPEKQYETTIRLRLDPKLMKRVEQYARKKKLFVRGRPNRSEAIRQLIEMGLEKQ